MTFIKAERKKTRLRLCLMGISGSGKTKSALRLAKGMGGKVAVIDTERGSSALYSDEFDFDICTIEAPFSPIKYINAIKEAEKAGYTILIIDSWSHAWAGEGGILDIHKAKTKGSAKGNSYMAWNDVTPQQNQLLECVLQCKMHVILTMRCKTHYDIVDSGDGKKVPIKIGLAPIQRADSEYEFDCVLELSQNNYASVASNKDRTRLFIGRDFIITEDDGIEIVKWLNAGSINVEIDLATREQLKEFKELSDILALTDSVKQNWLRLNDVTSFDKMTQKSIAKILAAMHKKINANDEQPVLEETETRELIKERLNNESI